MLIPSAPCHLRISCIPAFAACIFTATMTIANRSPAAESDSIVPLMGKPSINVVITVSDMEKSKEFYGGVLGLEPMAPIAFSDKTNPVFFPEAITMERYRVGTSEIKLIPGLDRTQKHPGGIETGIGFRMVNFPIRDIDAFLKRVEEHGLPKPQVSAMPGSNYRFGMLRDPDDNQVEFFYYEGDVPGQGYGGYDTIHIALTVSDVEKTRAFYGGVLGLTELPPVPMPGNPGAKVYLYRLGDTLIKFWKMADGLPTYSGRHLEAYGFRYLQYQVKDIDAAHEHMKKHGADIDLPPTSMESAPVYLMFVADPDGIINEFFGVKP